MDLGLAKMDCTNIPDLNSTNLLCLTPRHAPLMPKRNDSRDRFASSDSTGLVSVEVYNQLMSSHVDTRESSELEEEHLVDNGNVGESGYIFQKFATMSLDEFLAVVKDRKWSKFLFYTFPVEDIYRVPIFDHVLKNGLVASLAKDPYGNFLIQSMVTNAGDYAHELFRSIFSEIVELSTNRFGCRVVQCLVDKCPTDMAFALVDAFQGHEVLMTVHSYASHVIQRIIQRHSPDVFAPLVDKFCEGTALFAVVQDKFGCRIVQKLLDRLVYFTYKDAVIDGFSRRLLNKMTSPIVERALEFASNEYANYVVQHIICTEKLSNLHEEIVQNCIRGNILSLSQEKYASHVVEKSFQKASPSLLRLLCEEIFYCYEADMYGREAIDILLFDQFGNYVIQRLLTICIEVITKNRQGDSEWFFVLRDKILVSESKLQRYSSGKKILEKIAPFRHLKKLPSH
jgi:pumilio RNA-binding family